MKNYVIICIVLAVCSYLVGNFNNAITISKLKGKDIRTVGSGNPGTMNMSRTFGLKIGLLVFWLDAFKGILPTLVATLVFKNYKIDGVNFPPYMTAQVLCGFSAVLGHVFPVFYRFKGGKGIATTLGVFVVVHPGFTWGLGIIGLLFIFVTRMGSMGSFLATTPTAISIIIKASFNYGNNLTRESIGFYALFCLTLCLTIALTWFAHRENIKRLLKGSEHNTDWWLSIKKGVLKKKYKKGK